MPVSGRSAIQVIGAGADQCKDAGGRSEPIRRAGGLEDIDAYRPYQCNTERDFLQERCCIASKSHGLKVAPALTLSRETYQIRQLFAGTIGVPALQLKAPAKPGWFTIGPFTRKCPGACASVCAPTRTASSRWFSHQFCA